MHPTLSGEKVILKPLSVADVNENYLSWLQDSEVTKGLATGGYTIESLQRYVGARIQNPRIAFYGIYDKDSTKHIGNVKIDYHDESANVSELGILIGDKEFWGKGIGRETCQLIIRYAFDHLNLRKIYLAVYENNPSARKLYENLGFIQEGVQIKHIMKENKYWDKYLFGINKVRWQIYQTRDVPLVLRNYDQLNQNELQEFSASSLFAEVNYDYKNTLKETKYYKAYYDRHLNHTFVIKHLTEYLLYASICPLDLNRMSYFKFPVKVFINRNYTNHTLFSEVIRLFKLQIIHICKVYGYTELEMYDEPLLTNLFFDKDMKSSIQVSAIVNLQLSVEAIKKLIRRRYKTYINWGEKNLVTRVFNSSNISPEIFAEFEAFHLRIAGRKTRKAETWALQFEMIKNDEAYLVVSTYNSQIASANLYLAGISEVEYGVGVNDRELSEKHGFPISHYPMFAAILYAKERGFKIFNLNTINDLESDSKHSNISNFKKGFATEIRSDIVNYIKIE